MSEIAKLCKVERNSKYDIFTCAKFQDNRIDNVSCLSVTTGQNSHISGGFRDSGFPTRGAPTAGGVGSDEGGTGARLPYYL